MYFAAMLHEPISVSEAWSMTSISKGESGGIFASGKLNCSCHDGLTLLASAVRPS